MDLRRLHSRLRTARMLFAGWLVLCSASLAPGGEAKTFQVDPKIQDIIERWRQVRTHEDEAAYSEFFETLTKEYGPTYESLIPQLVWFSAHATSSEKASLALTLLDMFDVDDIVDVLVPYLATEDEKFRECIKKVLAERDRAVVCGPCGYERFKYLSSEIWKAARRSEEPPAALVRFLYDVRPGIAMLEMMRAYMRDQPQTEWRPLIWAEYVVRDALWKKSHGFPEKFRQARKESLAQLETLSRHPRWFVRLYVATINRKYPELRDAKTVDRLKQDPHPLVREAAEAAGP